MRICGRFLLKEDTPKARKLDLADRYLNTKCVRYALRAGAIDEAHVTASLFLRDGDNLSRFVDGPFDLISCVFQR